MIDVGVIEDCGVWNHVILHRKFIGSHLDSRRGHDFPFCFPQQPAQMV
jgi:hypothetical protein